MGWVLASGDRRAVNISRDGEAVFLVQDRKAVRLRGGSVLEKAFHAFEDFAGRFRRVYNSAKFAAVPHAMSKPASELLHFAYTIGQAGSINLPIVVHE
jgi:hypothetical protein